MRVRVRACRQAQFLRGFLPFFFSLPPSHLPPFFSSLFISSNISYFLDLILARTWHFVKRHVSNNRIPFLDCQAALIHKDRVLLEEKYSMCYPYTSDH